MTMRDPEWGPEHVFVAVCNCGRAVRLLNLVSDTPKCEGCGWTPDKCPCQVVGG